MKRLWLSCFVLAAVASLNLFSAARSQAEEPYYDFLNGLRNRGYHDYAIYYLEDLESRPNLDPEFKKVIPYEKAITLMTKARLGRNPETQTQELDAAEAFLDQFTKANPLHPKTAEANTQRARILIGKAKVDIWQSRSPANETKKQQLQESARGLIVKAREILTAAKSQHETHWKSFPVHIDRVADPKQFEERSQAEIAYMQSQLDLALCTYEEAQTYDRAAPEFSKILTQASNEFEEIHARYRSQVGGLYARLWQAKCFEEQDDIGKALGIYNELLGHGKGERNGPGPALQRLQEQALHFRLICLNHDQRKDYKLVIQEATEYLNRVGPRGRRTPHAIAIRWERARAYEALGNNRTLPEAEQKTNLNLALSDANEINQYPGEYKDVSTFMKQRLEVALKGNAQDPTEFDGALGLARNLIKQISDFNDAIKQAQAKGDQKAVEDQQVSLDNHLNETVRILRLTLSLARPDTDLQQVNQAQYYLAYAYYLQRRSYEAAILGEFVGRHFDPRNPQLGADAAYLALAAYVQAYNAVKKGESKDFEMLQMARVCDLITKGWPNSEKANDARMTLGRIYSQLKQPVESGKWYSDVPETAPQYIEAQLAAGQSYWTAYLEAASLPDDQKPSPEELSQWQAAALKHLQTGVTERKSKLGETSTPPEDYIAAKASLAQIAISQGKYQDAIAELIAEPHSVISAVAVPPDAARPDAGIQSESFASLAYQLLLRAYVGAQKIDEALAAMAELEKIAGGAESQDIMQVYVQLGQELEQEIERLKNAGDDERLSEVRSSFEKFLNQLFERRDNMTANSMIWIAETYYGLAKGMGDDAVASADYYSKAAETYQEIINNAQLKGAEWMDSSRLAGVRLRLVNCRRRQGNFQVAKDLCVEVIKERPKALEAQVEAAYILQNWAQTGQDQSGQRYLQAINGVAEDGIWGWGQISKLLMFRIDAGNATPEQEEEFINARYNLAVCRREYGLQQNDKERVETLETCKREIEAFVVIMGEIPDEWWAKFDSIYQAVQNDQGVAQPLPLEKPEVYVASPPAPAEKDVAEKQAKPAPEKTTVAAAQPEPVNTVAVAIGFLLALATAAGIFFWMRKPAKRVKVAYATAPVLPPTGGGTEQPARKRPAVGKPTSAPSRGTSSGGQPAPGRPAGGKPSAGAPQPKPRSAKPGEKPAAKPQPPRPPKPQG